MEEILAGPFYATLLHLVYSKFFTENMAETGIVKESNKHRCIIEVSYCNMPRLNGLD